MRTRIGERYYAHIRGVTIYKTFKGWYFKTREQVDFGPYMTRQQASLAREDFIRQVSLNVSFTAAPQVIKPKLNNRVLSF